MKYYIKSGQKAAIKGFRTGDWSDSEAIDKHNENIFTILYNKLITGEIGAFYQNPKGHLIIATRSTRPDVLVQVSHAWRTEKGEIIPTSHSNINSLEEFLKDQNFYHGEYIKEFTA